MFEVLAYLLQSTSITENHITIFKEVSFLTTRVPNKKCVVNSGWVGQIVLVK